MQFYAMLCNLNDMLGDFEAMLWDLNAMQWEKLKWRVYWYSMLCYTSCDMPWELKKKTPSFAEEFQT